MEFEDPGELRKSISKKLRNEDPSGIDLERENILDQLFKAVIACRKEFNWTNARIVNKKEEILKFKKAWDQNRTYEPTFKFTSFPYKEKQALKLLTNFEQETRKVDREKVANLGLEKLNHNDLREFFRGIFEEYKLYVRLHANIADREIWRKQSHNIWHFNSQTAHYANKKLQKESFRDEDEEKELGAEEVLSMWKNELERLEMDDYKVEVRNVSGCHNVPEDRTLVVAAGENEERKYGLNEAKQLTVHEVFHAARCYNGYQVTEDSDIPPILGVHTPFYDRAEEGGAVFREFKTDKLSEAKEKDYYLRTMAAYHWKQGLSFSKSVSKLVNLGATLKRAFALAARNREVMRHQIYLGGLLDWQSMESREKMMCGKVNEKWADHFWEEINSDGPLNKPEITTKDLFQSKEFAFDV